MGRARHGGLTAVYARCWVDGGAPALWPWQQILAGLCGSDALELLERDARMVAAGPGRFGRFVAVTDQLAAACRRSPACVVIDDVHAADPGALLLLRFVARSLARVRLALVITRRHDHRHSDGSAALLDEIEQEGTPLGLRHFDLTETTEFLAAHGLGDLDPALFLVLLRVTGGNPLFLRRVAALGAPGPAQSVPAGLRAAIDEAFQRLEPETRQVVQAAAALGPAPSVVEAAVAGTSVTAVLEEAGRAAKAGLVSGEEAGRFSFSHELVRAAAEDAMATLDRVETHARAAAVLAGDGPAAPAWLARRAYHALRAAPRSAADARQAVAACRAAATSMIGSLAYERADALLSTAIELHDSLDLGPPAASLLVQWAEAALMCGRLAEARARFGRAASAADRDADPRTFAQAVLGLGGVWVSEHRSAVDRARVLGLQRAALARLPAGDSVLRCRLRTRTRLAAEAVYDGAPLDDVRSSVGQARRSGDARALAEALSLCHHAMLSRAPLPECPQVAEELIDVASETDLGVLALMGLCWRTVDLFQLADPRATRALEDLRQQADALAWRSIPYIVEVLSVMVLLRAGRLDDALARAAQAYELGTAVGDIDAFAYLGAQTVAIRWMQGREAELLDLVEEAASSPTLIQLEFAFRATAAHVAARAGLLERARTTLDALAAAGLAALPRSSTWQTGMTAIVEVAAALDDGEIARQAYELLEPLAALPTLASVGILRLGSTERPLGLAAMTYGDLDRAAGHLERAVDANRHLPNRPMTTIARADLAEVLRRRGLADRRRAAELLDQAIAEAGRMSMTARAERWRTARDGLAENAAADSEGNLSRTASGWLVSLGDHRTMVGDLVGMRYLAELLTRPAEHLSALALASHGQALDRSAPQELLDSTARSAYAARARELAEELAEAEANADLGRAEKLRTEMEALVDRLQQATGQAGHSRSFAGPPERARTAVRKAIKRAIDEVDAADPSIRGLLRTSIVTGTTCAYLPDAGKPLRWVVRQGSH